jgi:hypothetical protein
MTAYRCCRHCCPGSEHHPATPDSHDTPCGPAWCTEGSTPADDQLALEMP